MSYLPVVFVSVWLTTCSVSVTVSVSGWHLFWLTEDVFELGRLAFPLLEVTAEDDLLPVLSFVVEWGRADCCCKQTSKREWEDVDHFVTG